jgi:hypothetical protein
MGWLGAKPFTVQLAARALAMINPRIFARNI